MPTSLRSTWIDTHILRPIPLWFHSEEPCSFAEENNLITEPPVSLQGLPMMLRTFLNDSRPWRLKIQIPIILMRTWPSGFQRLLYMGITWVASEIQRSGTCPWDSKLGVWGAAWAVGFLKPPQVIYDSQVENDDLVMTWLDKANTPV